MSKYQLLSFEITNKQIQEWEPLDKNHQEPVDCAINVLHFFNIIDKEDIAGQLSKLKNVTKKGTLYAEIIYFLNQKYKDYKFKIKRIDTNEYFIKLLNEIPLKNGIISLLGRTEMGHANIIAKNNNNIIYILDPQQNSHFQLNSDYSNLNNFINDNKYNSFSTIFVKPKKLEIKNKIARNRKETKIQIRKPSNVSEQHTRKKRKIKVTPKLSKTISKKKNSVESLTKLLDKLKI